jgi:sec-independent protein translocase protein TatA
MIAKAIFLIGLPSGPEFLLILAAVVLFFGGKKIPELMRGIGQGIREFNDAKSNVKKEIEKGMSEKNEKPESTDNTKSVN